MILCLLGCVLLGNTALYGQTQSSMNVQAQKAYNVANKELNTVYHQVLKQYASQKVFIKKFKNAERIWMQFRDAEVASRYPNAGSYGTSEAMCRLSMLTSLTKERSKVLRVWLDGIPEGDVCNGSVKIKR